MSDVIKTIGKLLDAKQSRDCVHVAIAPVVAAEQLKPGDRVRFVKGSTELVTQDVDNPIGIVDPFLNEAVNCGDSCWMFLMPGSITSLRHDFTHPAFDVALPPPRPSTPLTTQTGDFWRTSDVVAVATDMYGWKDRRSYRSHAILADALIDAGCLDSKMIDVCRDGTQIESLQLAIAKAYSEETARAAQWLEQFAQQIDMGVKSLMAGAEEYLASGDYTRTRDETTRDAFYGNEEAFWTNYALVVGREIKNKTASFFTCSC